MQQTTMHALPACGTLPSACTEPLQAAAPPTSERHLAASSVCIADACKQNQAIILYASHQVSSQGHVKCTPSNEHWTIGIGNLLNMVALVSRSRDDDKGRDRIYAVHASRENWSRRHWKCRWENAEEKLAATCMWMCNYIRQAKI